jgi:hypothetical protein
MLCKVGANKISLFLPSPYTAAVRRLTPSPSVITNGRKVSFQSTGGEQVGVHDFRPGLGPYVERFVRRSSLVGSYSKQLLGRQPQAASLAEASPAALGSIGVRRLAG